MAAKPITPKQIAFIEDLVNEKLGDDLAALGQTAPEWMEANGIYQLTVQGASALIKTLQGLPSPSKPRVAAEDEVSQILAAAKRSRDNLHGGPCQVCGIYVGAGEGKAALNAQNVWQVVHRTAADCGVDRPSQAAQATSLDLSSLPLTSTGHGSDEAYFAVPHGDTRLKVRVRRVTKAGRWEGFIFVDDGAAYGRQTKYGRQAPGGSYSGGIQDALEAIVADPQAALARYASLTDHCGVCNRPLEDALSVAMGIGPVCREKLGIVPTEDELAHAKAGTKPERW